MINLSLLRLANPGSGGKIEEVSGSTYVKFWEDHPDALEMPMPPAAHVLFLQNFDEEWGADWFERDSPRWEYYDLGDLPEDCKDPRKPTTLSDAEAASAALAPFTFPNPTNN